LPLHNRKLYTITADYYTDYNTIAITDIIDTAEITNVTNVITYTITLNCILDR